ncbi:MAG: hypothetical protein ACRC3G_01805, partial [Bacteroidales bacterium]
WVCDYYLQFLSGVVDIVNMRTGELYEREDFKDDSGEYIIVSKSTVWNIINDPKNAAIVESYRMNKHRYVGTVRPHYHRSLPNYSLSKISLDDRDLPRKMHGGGRVKAYYAYDVASGVLLGAAYSRNKDTALFIDCIRDMFRFIQRRGYGMPMEIEVEHHIVSLFKDDLAKSGVVFPFVRFCAAGNSQEKHAEQMNKRKKYGFEKRYQSGIGRFYAKNETERSGGERVFDEKTQMYTIKEKTYSFEELVADDRASIKAYNNGKHRKDKSRTCMQVLEESINPNLAEINIATLARYIGDKTTTSIVRNMYVQVQYAKYALPSPEVLGRLGAKKYKVDAYYLPSEEGEIGEVYLYQNGEFISEAKKIVAFNTSQAESTESDKLAKEEQAKYITKFDKMIKDSKENFAPVKIIENKKNYEELIPEIVPVEYAELQEEDNFEEAVNNYDESYISASALDNL